VWLVYKSSGMKPGKTTRRGDYREAVRIIVVE
jgi:hypothetical protein